MQQQAHQQQTNENAVQKAKLQKMNSWHKRRAASLLVIEQSLNESNFSMDNEEDNENDANLFFTNDLRNSSSSESCDECDSSSRDSDTSTSDANSFRRHRSQSNGSSFSDHPNLDLENEESNDYDGDGDYNSEETGKKKTFAYKENEENDGNFNFVAILIDMFIFEKLFLHYRKTTLLVLKIILFS